MCQHNVVGGICHDYVLACDGYAAGVFAGSDNGRDCFFSSFFRFLFYLAEIELAGGVIFACVFLDGLGVVLSFDGIFAWHDSTRSYASRKLVVDSIH